MRLTPNERKELNAWLAEGNAANSNPWNVTDEKGNELDFVSAMRMVADLAEEHMVG